MDVTITTLFNLVRIESGIVKRVVEEAMR